MASTGFMLIGLRFLWRVSTEIRQCECVEVLHRLVRLLAVDGFDRQPNLLSTRGSQSFNRHSGPHKSTGSTAGSPPWGSHVRSAVVRPRRPVWLGHFAQRSGLHFWARHKWDVQPHQRPHSHREGPSAGHGRVQLVSEHWGQHWWHFASLSRCPCDVCC